MQDFYIAGVARRLGVSVLIAAFWLTASVSALAADPKVEKDAQQLQKKAIEEDYLNVDYAAAVKNLKAAAAKCGADKCKPQVKGAILRDLGAMQILSGASDEGKLSFTQALSLDVGLELDPSYKTPQLATVWAEAKKNAIAAPAPEGPTPSPGPAPSPSPTPGQVVTGDFTHAAAAELAVRTPLAIYAEYPGTAELGRVVVKYKGFGMTDWKTVELKKLDKGFGAIIPCGDVMQGPLQYYLQGLNTSGEAVAALGSKNKPVVVTVKAQAAGPAPALPGQPPPAQCPDSGSECPPDFPGCKSAKKEPGAECAKDLECLSGSCADGKCGDLKGSGEACQSEAECKSGACDDGKCVVKKAEGEECESSDECESGRCKNGTCAAPPGGGLRRIWVGLGVQADWYFMPAGNNICARTLPGGLALQPGVAVTSTGYGCVDSSGSQFPPTEAVDQALVQQYDRVLPGPAFGNVRLLASFDYALNTSMLVGARAGYVLLTDPYTGSAGAAFAPIHLEGRFTYLFGKDALLQTIAPMLFVGLGAGEFDAYVPVKVDLRASMSTTGPAGAMMTVKTPYDAGGIYTVNAWQTAGPFFLSIGGGARFGLGPATALTGGLKLQGAFGGTSGSLWGFAPEVGIQFGL